MTQIKDIEKNSGKSFSISYKWEKVLTCGSKFTAWPKTESDVEGRTSNAIPVRLCDDAKRRKVPLPLPGFKRLLPKPRVRPRKNVFFEKATPQRASLR